MNEGMTKDGSRGEAVSDVQGGGVKQYPPSSGGLSLPLSALVISRS